MFELKDADAMVLEGDRREVPDGRDDGTRGLREQVQRNRKTETR